MSFSRKIVLNYKHIALLIDFSESFCPPCSLRKGSKTNGSKVLLAIEPALETTFPAAEAEFAAVSTKVVTAEFRLYQITNLLIALERLLFDRDSFST